MDFSSMLRDDGILDGPVSPASVLHQRSFATGLQSPLPLPNLSSPNGQQMNQLQQEMFDINLEEFVDTQSQPIQPKTENISSVLSSVNGSDSINDVFLDMHFPEVTQLPDTVICDPESPYINQWQKINNLMLNGSDVVKRQIDRMWLDNRESEFDFTIRKRLADVLEYMRWDKVSPHDNEITSKLISKLYGQILEKLNQNEFAQDHEFRFALQRLNDRLANPYFQAGIALHIKEVFNSEKAIIDFSEMQQNAPMLRIQRVSADFENVEKLCYETDHAIQSLQNDIQNLQLSVQGQLQYIDMISVEGWNPTQREHLRSLIERRNTVSANVTRTVQELWNRHGQIAAILKKVLDEELKEYQRNQAFINNGKLLHHYCSINQLQEWCKKLAMIISNYLQLVDKLMQFVARPLGLDSAQAPNNQPTTWQWIGQLKLSFQAMIEELVQKALIVDKHPPQVLMKDKRFQCTLRHLVGDALDIHRNFRVTAHLVNAEQAIHALNEGPKSEIRASGSIVNHEASSDFLTHAGILSVNMRNMQLKMQQRGAQRAQETVAELKFAMLFRAKIDLCHHPSQPTTVIAQTISLPIVVISHGKQEADAQATIFWDNAFAAMNRKPFEVDENVLWSDLLEALDGRWKKECGDSSSGNSLGLDAAAKQYLTMKLFHHPEVRHGTTISWQKFNHDKVQVGFTFWTWFFKAMELCSNSHIRKYWNKGYIRGFISKGECQELLLKNSRPGEFLFRFSETKLGAISISCTNLDKSSRIVVHNLEPDDIKKFQVRSLPDMVKDLEYLTFLYPGREKHQVFGQYYTKPEPTHGQGTENGYIGKIFVVTTKVGGDTRETHPLTPQSAGYPEYDNSMDESPS